MLQAVDVKKSYDTVDVLRGVTVEIGEAEIVSIVGASGAGKSTLLHIMGTLDVPDSGSVLFDGKNVSKMKSAELARFRNKNLGFIFQFHNLLPEFTALENVMLPGLLAGKSTLLHILGTLDVPDSGSVLFDGNNVSKMKSAELARFRNKNLGFIFQFHNLLPEFTALENVMLPGLLAGKNEKQVKDRGIDLLTMLNLAHRLHHKPSEMSGGEQQRTSVSRALINSPRIVFADEPSGNLDPKNARELHDIFFRLRDDMNQTFVIVTHNDELAAMTDRRIVMRDGILAV